MDRSHERFGTMMLDMQEQKCNVQKLAASVADVAGFHDEANEFRKDASASEQKLNLMKMIQDKLHNKGEQP